MLLLLSSIAESKALHDFNLPSLNDPTKLFSLSEFKGKLVLLNFWTLRCPYCREELPILDKIQTLYPNDIKIISILYAPPQDVELARDWLSQNKIENILVLLDRTGKVFSSYNVPAVPYTVIISKDGEKLTDILGALPEEAIVSLIQKFLK